MVTNEEFLQWCSRNGLSPEAQALVCRIRSSPPSRTVKSRAGNVSGRYPSRKMGVTIQFESHRVELAVIYEMEYDPDVLEYYDQPPPIKLDYHSPAGRHLGVISTPDFFVIRTDEAGWEECKMEDELARLAVKAPQRYVRSEDGAWRCPPGERYARKFGLYYRFRSSSKIDWVYQRNIQFMEDYLRVENWQVTAETAKPILSAVASNPGITVAEMLDTFNGANADNIYTLIATGQMYVDLRSSVLADPKSTRVFRDRDTAAFYVTAADTMRRATLDGPHFVNLTPGTPIIWDGKYWSILNVGDTTVVLMTQDGNVVEVPSKTFHTLLRDGKLTGLNTNTLAIVPDVPEQLRKASPKQMSEANRRFAAISPYLSKAAPLPTPSQTSSRTLRRWLADYRRAEALYGYGILGLFSRAECQGNRNKKLPASTLALLDEFVANDYESLKQKRKFESYAVLLKACHDHSIVPPSYSTFAKAVAMRSTYQQVAKRKGRRAAYEHECFFWELTLTTPRHGDRPFEIAHIDHTELDIELVHSRTGKNLGRPWATFVTDAFSRRLLAFYLTFDPPSYRSCMMALRIYVQRTGRMPQIVVVDGGAEFQSVYFETLLATYQCIKKTRPGAKARFGSVCERLFGTTNTRFIHNLAGNTQITKNVRQVTKAVNPRNHAVWTLASLYERLYEWTYEVYETIEHPSLGQTPREAFAAGLAMGGIRQHRLIPYDDFFRMLTLPTTPKGTAKVQPARGIKVNYFRYWCDDFRNPEVENSQVPVRWDPFDMGTAYAFVNGHWVTCISEYYSVLQGRTEREVMLASAELRKRRQNSYKDLEITAKRLADFLVSTDSEEALAVQRMRDSEARQVLRAIGGSYPASRSPREPQDVPSQDTTEVKSKPIESACNELAELECYEEYK